MIACLGSLFLVFSFWSAYQAATRSSAVTDRHYYSHGLRYNDTLVEQKAAESLGWTPTVSVDGHTVEVRLTDREGRPVSGCQGHIVLLDAGVTVSLAEDDASFYRAALTPGLQGEVAARLEISRDGARISRRLILNL